MRVTKLLAHRPSRRDEIIDAAVAVFATHGFVDASVNDVAESAGVAVTAVYYHFAGKEELYEAAITTVLRTVDEIVARVRPDDEPAQPGDLNRTIDAVWEWVDEHPAAATLMHLHTPSATRQAAGLRHEFDELHVQRAFAYLDDGAAAPLSLTRQAVAGLAVRTLVDMLIAIHPMRLAGGPLSEFAPNQVKNAVKNVSARLLSAV
jgi:AcrR family transcriptional regulator